MSRASQSASQGEARRRLSLVAALGWSHALTVILLALLLALGAGQLLRRLAYEQARLQMAELAAGVVRELELAHAQLRVAARLLAERPTLAALARTPEDPALLDFVERFRRSGVIHTIRLEFPGGKPLEVGRETSAWSEARYLIDAPEHIVVQRTAPWLDGGQIRMRRRLSLTSLLPRGLPEGAQLVLHELEAAQSGDPSLESVLMRRHVLAGLRAESAVLHGEERFLAMEPLLGNQGEALGLLEIVWPMQQVEQRWREWVEGFALLLLLCAATAAAIGLLLARRIGAAFAGLHAAAGRIGAGDLETPVALQDSGIREGQALGLHLEEMRRDLLDARQRERQQAQALVSVLDGVQEAILSVDGERRIRYHNRQLAELCGNTAEAIQGAFCGDVLRPLPVGGRPRCDVDCPLLAARSHGAAETVERCMGQQGGRDLVVRAASLVDDRQVLIVREQTAIEAARSMRESILANLSHEFRTPLAGQIAAIELLRDHLAQRGDSAGLDLATAQHRAVLRLSQLVDNLLESASVEAGRAPLRLSRVDLRELLEEALALMQPLLQRRRQQLIGEWPQDLAPLLADRRRLLQVFLNLIGNANKFAPDDSNIFVRGQSRADGVEVWVEDQGPGLSGPVSADPFAGLGLAPAAAPERQGHGLGLAIARSIVERHGGRLLAASGDGGRIGFFLPWEAKPT